MNIKASDTNRDRPNCYRVYLGNEDVTDRCFEADDLSGYVLLYLRDAQGHFYKSPTNAHEPAWERLEGQVSIDMLHP